MAQPADLEDDLRRQLLARTAGDVQVMREAAARGDLEAIARLAHRLRGAAGALQLAAVGEAGGRIEQCCRGQRAEEVPALIERLAAEVARCAS